MGGRYIIVRMGKGWVVLDSHAHGAIVFAAPNKSECNDWIAWAKAQV